MDSHDFPTKLGTFFLVPRLHLSFFDNPSSLKNFTLSGFRSSCSSQCRKKAASSWSASCWTAVGEMGKWLVSPRTRLQLWPSYHHYHHCHRYNVTTTTTSSIINKTIIYIYNYIIIIMAWSSWSRSCYHDDQTIPHDTKHQPTLQIQTNTRSSLYWHWHVKGLQKVLNRWDISWLDGSKYHHHSSIRYFIVFHVPYGDPANIPRYRNNSSACVCSVASASCRGHWNALGGVPSGNLT